MKVTFVRGWFAPDRTFYRRGTYDDVPAEWRDKLPKSAEVEGAVKEKPEPKKAEG